MNPGKLMPGIDLALKLSDDPDPHSIRGGGEERHSRCGAIAGRCRDLRCCSTLAILAVLR